MSLPGHQVSFHQCHQHISLRQASHWTWIELPTHPPHQALPLFGRRPAICRAKDRGKQNTAYQRWTKASLASSTPAGPICCASSPWWHLINYCPWCTGKQNQPESSWAPPKGGHDKKQNKKPRKLLLEPAEKFWHLHTWKWGVKKQECLQCLFFEAGDSHQDPLRDDSTGLKAVGFIGVQILTETN